MSKAPSPRAARSDPRSSKTSAALPAKPTNRRPGRPAGRQLLADKQQLLAAAERVIRSDGPDVSMEVIAAAATVTKPILYRTVGDRDALVTALAEIVIDRINDAAAAAIAKARSPRTRLRALIAAYADVVDNNRNLYLFVIAGGASVDRVGQLLRLADRSAIPLAHRIAAQRSAAGADPDVALTWAFGVIGTLQFATLWWLRDGHISADQLVEHITELLWSGLGGQAQRPD